MEKYNENIKNVSEKPQYLYHGSPNKNIEEFEPRISGGTGESHGPLVYATPDIAIASAFMADVGRSWSAGFINNIPYVVIPINRDVFLENDKGGSLYTLPSESFDFDVHRGLGRREWASKEKVRPVEKKDHESAIDTMIEHGVQVYFVGEDFFQQLKISEDKGGILNKIESENQHRGQNIKTF